MPHFLEALERLLAADAEIKQVKSPPNKTDSECGALKFQFPKDLCCPERKKFEADSNFEEKRKEKRVTDIQIRARGKQAYKGTWKGVEKSLKNGC